MALAESFRSLASYTSRIEPLVAFHIKPTSAYGSNWPKPTSNHIPKRAEPAKPAALQTETTEAQTDTAESAVAEPSTDGAGISISDGTAITDEQLFLFLRDLIENEQLFLQPDFGRQTLIERTGLSKDRIGAAFAQGSDSASLPAYVRELRLDHAVRLMNDKPELTVEQVSMASGFTSADTFTRNFRAKFGMTPTTYKQTQNDA